MWKHTLINLDVIEGGPEAQPLHGSCVYTVVEESRTGEKGLTCNIYLFMFLPCELIGGGWDAWHGKHV